MPLPAALLARLAKRGLVETKPEIKLKPDINKAKSRTKPPGTEEVEEVFAEDYDDPSKPEVTEPAPPAPVVAPAVPVQPVPVHTEEPVYFETTACPNRKNPYHLCVPYCKNRYGLCKWEPIESMLKRRDRMLRKYPLPENWQEVGDFDTGRYYYWNIITDQVSWLSPLHPKCELSQSAEQLGLIGKIGNLDSEGEEEVMETNSPRAGSESDSDTSLSDEEEPVDKSKKIESHLSRFPPGREQAKPAEATISTITKKGGRTKKDDLDPMDPAAYSDIARGGWNEGLDTRGKAKTGVDTTASGPLFQQRPYPSPGDILRANQSLKKKK